MAPEMPPVAGPGPRERDLVVEGRSWHLYEDGPASAPPVVLLHGYHGSGRFFMPIMRALADRWYLLAPDLPGHCASGPWPPGERAVEQWLLLDGLLEALDVRGAALVGHSRGGIVCTQLCARRSHRARALMVFGTPGRPYQVGTLNIIEMFVDPSALSPDLLREVRACSAVARGYDEARARGIAAGDIERGLTPVLPSVRVPTLVLWGERDTTVPQAAARHVADLAPGAEWRVVRGAGHMWPLEDPAAFAAEVRAFLERPPPAGPGAQAFRKP
jgi:pimeloyl-ACP methyl ester carboxylesterase